MNDIIHKHNIVGPINILFPRSEKVKKKKYINYNMSGLVPKIKVETEKSSRPTVQLKNPVNIQGINIIKDDSMEILNKTASTMVVQVLFINL